METINGWKQVGSSFAKEKESGLYDVIRIETSSEHIFYDIHRDVNLAKVVEEVFSRWGDYQNYLALKTSEEKAVYYAFCVLHPAASYSIDELEEVTTYLKEDGVISESENYELVI